MRKIEFGKKARIIKKKDYDIIHLNICLTLTMRRLGYLKKFSPELLDISQQGLNYFHSIKHRLT